MSAAKFQCPSCGAKTTVDKGVVKVPCRCGAMMRKVRRG